MLVSHRLPVVTLYGEELPLNMHRFVGIMLDTPTVVIEGTGSLYSSTSHLSSTRF